MIQSQHTLVTHGYSSIKAVIIYNIYISEVKRWLVKYRFDHNYYGQQYIVYT